jgi:hypothetical protein
VIVGLIQWSNLFPEDATWEDLEELRKQFPEYNTQLMARITERSCGSECI